MSRYPERIVCLTEETTETLYLLGEGHRVVGISGYTCRPKEARQKPKVSAFTSAKIDQILELRPEHNWTDYPIGVARELAALEFPIDAANLFVRSTVPEGSGLSSSAALEVASALALLKSRPLDSRELARLCQRAEHNFVGIPCGIMDQYCSLLGHEQAALDLDCRSLEHRLAPLPAGIVFVAVNTTVKHALATSAYQQHVAECTTAARLLRVDSLRDLAPGPFAAMADSLPRAIARRVRHVLTENERVAAFSKPAAAAIWWLWAG